MEFSAYISYFEAIARSHRQIAHSEQEKHFCRMNIEEVISDLRSQLLYPALLLESFEGGIIDHLSDNFLDKQEGAFMILKQCHNDDFEMENLLLDECRQIGMDIISRMIKDRRDFLLQGFDPASVHYQKVGPVFDNAFGYRFSFSIETAANASLQYRSERWL